MSQDDSKVTTPSEKNIRESLLKAIGSSPISDISTENLLKLIKNRLLENDISYNTAEQDRFIDIGNDDYLSGHGYVLLSAKFGPNKGEIENIFNKDVLNLMQNPAYFRKYGWDLATSDKPKPVEGDYFETKDTGIKTLRVYRDGMVISAASISTNFLSWGTDDIRATEGKQFLNALATVEYITNFIQFTEMFRVVSNINANDVLFSFELHKPTGDMGLLMPSNLFKKATGNFSGDQKVFKFEVNNLSDKGIDYEKVSYYIIERFYQLFGLSYDDFKYVDISNKKVLISSFEKNK